MLDIPIDIAEILDKELKQPTDGTFFELESAFVP